MTIAGHDTTAPRSPGNTCADAGPAGARGPGALLSLIAPAHNEQDNIAPLVAEVALAFTGLRALGVEGEFIIVDDGSTDGTRAAVLGQLAQHPFVRCVAMSQTPPGKGNGQSAAFHAGIRAARGGLIATIDADLQNDPADLVKMVQRLRDSNADMVQGDRSHARRDNLVRKVTSVIGRFFRGLILADAVRDTGCSLRVMKREFALLLPLGFRGMHRFIPVTVAHLGGKVVEMNVTHRPRVAGTTKYGFGIWQRAVPGLIDCFAVRYMKNRRRSVASVELAPQPSAGAGAQAGVPR
jgi:glycosyltransferase involved in cell wall biosynthesis